MENNLHRIKFKLKFQSVFPWAHTTAILIALPLGKSWLRTWINPKFPPPPPLHNTKTFLRRPNSPVRNHNHWSTIEDPNSHLINASRPTDNFVRDSQIFIYKPQALGLQLKSRGLHWDGCWGLLLYFNDSILPVKSIRMPSSIKR